MLDALLRFLVLDPAVTDTEQAHVDRINAVARRLLLAHVPLYVAIAWWNDTGPLVALMATAALQFGPWLSARTQDARTTSHVVAFTYVCAAGLLVHFGQGPVQIEMHFYFFVLLGLLSVYGNPMVIATAAATTAVHHLAVYAFAPASVFNYEASVWVVALHALFVVLQSPASMFIARSFHDNVIGLERTVAARTAEVTARSAELRLVLDAMSEGLLLIDGAGRISGARSRFADALLGAPGPDEPFGSALGRLSPHAGRMFELGWEAVVDGLLPLELSLSQLPHRVEAHGRMYDVQYRVFEVAGDQPVRTLVTLTDVTERVSREASELRQREMVAIMRQLGQDRRAFLEFVDEARDLVGAATSVPGAGVTATLRQIHTLKGGAAQFGLLAFAEHCHALESAMIDDPASFGSSDQMELATRWQAVEADLATMLGSRSEDVIERPVDAVLSLARELRDRTTSPTGAADRLERWTMDAAVDRLGRLREQAMTLGRRLNRPTFDVTVDDGGLFFDRRHWRPFWASFVHAVRNAVDHGIEAVDDRDPAKPTTPTLAFVTRRAGDRLEISLSDDGRGIRWEAVRQAALRRGLPATSEADLIGALFADGVSTQDEVTDVSGRGVGMAALREVSERLGGRVEVDSAIGRGTTLRFVFPWSKARVLEAPTLALA